MFPDILNYECTAGTDVYITRCGDALETAYCNPAGKQPALCGAGRSGTCCGDHCASLTNFADVFLEADAVALCAPILEELPSCDMGAVYKCGTWQGAVCGKPNQECASGWVGCVVDPPTSDPEAEVNSTSRGTKTAGFAPMVTSVLVLLGSTIAVGM